jgi:hypothetical protein
MIAKMIYCCIPNKDELEIDFQNKFKKEIDNMNYKNDEEVDGVLSLFPSIYIREDERKYLKFSKEFIINYLSELSQKNFINKYEDKFMNLSILENNELSANTPVIRSEIVIQKSVFKKKVPTLEEFVYPIFNPELRIKWDKNYKEFELIRTINKNTHIARIISTFQLTVIPEREFYDKRTFFFDNGVFYYFCSSIPDHFYPPKTEPVRVCNYFGALIIKEDNENFYIDSFNQVDIKMDVPEALIIMSFPWKMKEFFDSLVELFNK